MRIALASAALLVAAGAAWWLARDARGPQAVTWRAVGHHLDARFPDVPTVSPADLADALDGDDAPILLDARTPAEYAVSRLPGAHRVDPDASTAELVDALGGSGRDVVVYCSVGVRSAAVARRLREAGVEAANLEGSIFRWANEGRPLVGDGGPAETVHPYNAVWGRLLSPEHRAEID